MGFSCLRKLCLRSAVDSKVSRVSSPEQHEASAAEHSKVHVAEVSVGIEAPSQKIMCGTTMDASANDESISLCVPDGENLTEVPAASKVPQGQTVTGMPAASSSHIEEKKLELLPCFSGDAELLGDVFVHGSGDCDQLGLGENILERKKPALVCALAGTSIRSIACGGLHTVCISSDGRLFSWGCGDDGVLGRSCGSDCEPGLVRFPESISVSAVACGDSHSCAIDLEGRTWLWGSYKDSSGYIGITPSDGSTKLQDCTKISQKRSEPAIIFGLDCVIGIASGANHSVALTSDGHVYSWGSNQSGQMGLQHGLGCSFFEEEISVADAKNITFLPLASDTEGVAALISVDSKAHQVICVRMQDGRDVDSRTMSVLQLQDIIAGDCRAVVLEVTDRQIPLPEKQSLLFPQRVSIDDNSGGVTAVFASCECTFLTTKRGAVYGCGLNCNGQVGAGYTSAGISAMTELAGIESPNWIGGGTHMSAALANRKVLTWGRAEECGHGAGARSPQVLRPRIVEQLPAIRTVRCGMSHTLACSEAGDVFGWGCGVSHQLGNRPRKWDDLHDARDEPTDEFLPYRLSSKQLEGRFVLLADAGAQHSVELAWTAQSDENQLAVVDESEDEKSTGAGESDEKVEETCIDENVEILKIETSADFWRVQIESIYRRRNPYKLQNVPSFLSKYEGQEALLYTKVCRKYDLDPSKWYADPRSWEGEEEDIRPEDPNQNASRAVEVGSNSIQDFGQDASGVVEVPHSTFDAPNSLFVFGEPSASTDPTPLMNCGPLSWMSPGSVQDPSDSEEEVQTDDKKGSKRKKRSSRQASLQENPDDVSEESDRAHDKKEPRKCQKKIIKDNHKFKKSKPHPKSK